MKKNLKSKISCQTPFKPSFTSSSLIFSLPRSFPIPFCTCTQIPSFYSLNCITSLMLHPFSSSPALSISFHPLPSFQYSQFTFTLVPLYPHFNLIIEYINRASSSLRLRKFYSAINDGIMKALIPLSFIKFQHLTILAEYGGNFIPVAEWFRYSPFSQPLIHTPSTSVT